MNKKLIHYAIKYKGDYFSIQKAIQQNEEVTNEQIEKIEQLINSGEIRAITITDKNYPESLRILKDPPYVIFYSGNIEVLNDLQPKASLIGENYIPQIQNFFNRSLDQIIKRHVLVTNGYKGVEQKVMEFFRLHEIPIIGVSVNGVENPWMFENFKDYDKLLIISEYPKGANINKKRLVQRNRLVAALSNFLVVYSLRQKGGSQNLVNFFLDLGKEIYCFYDDDYENLNDFKGSFDLIYQGANWITEIKDVYYKIGMGEK